MKILLDTNVILHTAVGKLPHSTVDIMQAQENTCYYSLISMWEIIIKIMKGKLDIRCTPEHFEQKLLANGYKRLELKPAHLHGLMELGGTHADPFDRLLISQARCENMTLLTTDKMLQNYPASIMLVSV